MKLRNLVLVSLALFLTTILCRPLLADEGDPPSRVARLSYIDHSVSMLPAGESGDSDWVLATVNYPVSSGDRFWTDKDAHAELETGSVAIRMAPETDLTVTNISDQIVQLGLAQGTLRVRSFSLPEGITVEVDTPNGAVTIASPGDYRFDVDPDQNTTVAMVNRGDLNLTGTTYDATLHGGQAVRLKGANPATVVNITAPASDDFDQWCAQRDGRFTDSRSAQFVSPNTPGYDDLDDHGTWATEAEYGPVWYPTGVAVGWAPYRFGRWIWVSPWGWTWLDDAPWGFAPFHYGRWALIGARWGWLPGPVVGFPVYGPAFVGFASGFSFGVGGGLCGWFPLGPADPFIPWYHYSGVYLRQVNVTNVRVVNETIRNVTTIRNVNNIHYTYARTAVTAMPADAFRKAEPVARNMVELNQKQLASAHVIAHPFVAPAREAIAAGAPHSNPPVARTRPVVPQTGRVGQALTGRPAETRPPVEARPADNVRPGPPATPRPLVNHAAPPPLHPSFEQTRPALEEHPGRPLEPQQRDNIRAGRPAGPMRDREVAPHASAPRSRR